jgi:hypothetical protein
VGYEQSKLISHFHFENQGTDYVYSPIFVAAQREAIKLNAVAMRRKMHYDNRNNFTNLMG